MPADADPFPSLDPARLEGRTVVLSGATGAVGSAVLRRLLEAGARVGLTARKSSQVARLREVVGSAPGLVAHVGSQDTEAATGFVNEVEDSVGPIDAFVSAAGAFAFAPVGSEPSGLDVQLFEANLVAAHTLVRAVVAPMRRRKSGNIVFTGAAVVGSSTPGMALYAASKAALHEYARTLAAETGADGLSVAVVAPGIIDTPANREAMPDADRGDWLPMERVADALLSAAVDDRPDVPVVRSL